MSKLSFGKIVRKALQIAEESSTLAAPKQDENAVLIRGTANGALSVAEVGFVALNTLAITRPADTTAYASGDLVANNVTAGSVTPLQFTVSDVAGTTQVPIRGTVTRARMRFNDETVTNAQFRLHLYTASPTPANGDNGAWKTTKHAEYLGSIDVTVDKVFTSNAVGISAAAAIPFELSAGAVLYGLLEARAAYTPTSGEVFNITIEGIRK